MSDPAGATPERRWVVRTAVALIVFVGAIQAFLAVAAGFSATGTAITALSAVYWVGLAWLLRYRASFLSRLRVFVALAAGIALMVMSASVAKIPSDRPDMPTVHRVDVEAGRTSASSSCGAYARSLLAPALLLRDASQRQRQHANQVAADMRVRSAADAKKAASFDAKWQPLYLAAWRINERWRGNGAVSDGEYRAAERSIGELCQPLSNGGQ